MRTPIFFLMISCSLAFNKPIINACTLSNLNNCHLIKDTTKKPTVFLQETTVQQMFVLYIRDTASATALSEVFARDYSEIFAFINNIGLKPGKPMAFYHKYTDPIVVEVAVQVENLPSEVNGRIKAKIVEGGPAVVAHYQGPYEDLNRPYNAITQWLKDNFRQARDLPFEIYLNDPMTVTDKYQLRTDVLQFLYQ